MSAANGRSAEKRLRRRRRKLAAATSTVLLVAAAVAGEPSFAVGAPQVAGGVGDGLFGMTGMDEVGASGRLNEDDEIGDYLIDADDTDSLLKLGGDGPSDGQLGIPGVVLDAYMNAADLLAEAQPGCNLDWSLLASIGRIESNHARKGRVDENGDTISPILGPVLNGGGFAAIEDTDGGKWDGDGRWDRAVGAMQFIPQTWEGYAADGNDDGVKSPHNVFDATLAAGRYLCSGGLDLSNDRDRKTAVFRYNHSDSYVATVLLWADAYANGGSPIEDYDVPSDDFYDEDSGDYAQGPPSTGTNAPPVQTPTTNTPPPGGTSPGNTPPPSNTHTMPPTATSGTGRPTLPPSPCSPTSPPPPTTTTTDPTPTTTTSAPTSSTTTTTTTTTTTPPPPSC